MNTWRLTILLFVGSLTALVYAGIEENLIFRDGFEKLPPVITSSPVTMGRVDELYSYDVDATDPDGESLLYLLTQSPAGMSINNSSGLISWKPVAVGDYLVEVDVSNESGGSASQAWMIAVEPAIDTDSDGLSDVREALWGTDPEDEDSDDDGLLDGEEVFTYLTDPLHQDSDRDGLTDGNEVDTHGTDPADVDTDSDGFGDGLELDAGTNPLDENDFPAGPPDPDAVATPINETTTTTVYDSTEFIWNGTPPIQTGVTEGTIAIERAIVLSGHVMDEAGADLPGVVITIDDHPEFGQTMSRVDGRFDMVVNGGAPLTVDYQKTGLLPAQRQVQTPWQNFVEVPDVAMIPLDVNVTEFDLNSGVMGVAQGSMIADDDGTRQATVMCPPGTTAELVFPDGSTQAITTLNVRATEYTVGDMGPEMMPAELPPTSAYTYALELSADEAMSMGADHVQFSQPLPFYVENFLGFPVGGPVPAGFYDRQQNAWLPSDNGVVIEILSETDGKADLDVDGDSVADTGQALLDLGITDEERENLATLYDPVLSLWRVLIPHFSPWDINWGISPPDDAEAPNQSLAPENPVIEDGICPIEGNSVIECQNQTLREAVRVTGTPFTLNYTSERTPARLDHNQLDLSLSGGELPASLKRIELKVNVAGQNHLLFFPPDPDQTTTFSWDGRDAFGRSVQGIKKISGSIGYVYDASYAEPAGRFGYNGNGVAIAGSSTRQELSLLQFFENNVGTWDARGSGLGGWTLDLHHSYDPVSRTLYLGDGRQRGADSLARIIDTVIPKTNKLKLGLTVGPDGRPYFVREHTVVRLEEDGTETVVAGGGTAPPPGYGDGGPALEAELWAPMNSLAFGSEGALYIQTGGAVRMVGTDGIIHTVAGITDAAGGAGCNDDGVVAAETPFCTVPTGMAVTADGIIYVISADNPNQPVWGIRRIGTDGIVDTFAGGAGRCDPSINPTCGDDDAVGDAQFVQLQAIAVGGDGSIYVSDFCAVRRIGADGIVSNFAGAYGGSSCGNSGGGGPAEDALLGQSYGLVSGNDGVYVSNRNGFIWLIGNDGILNRYAGGGTSGGDGPALAANIDTPSSVALAPDGSLYMVDSGGGLGIRKVGTLLQGLGEDSIQIASEDGGEIYLFDGNGRHLRTLHALTGATLVEFDYDSDGRLSQIIQKTGGTDNVTMIEHNQSGTPTKIISPFGQETLLTVDASGFLNSIANPAAENIRMEYSPKGLLSQVTDAAGYSSYYGYDALGRLIRVDDPAGGFQTLARTEIADGFEVVRTTGQGITTTYRVEHTITGESVVTNEFVDGTFTELLRGADGSRQITMPEGTIFSETLGPDPRFGMQTALATAQTAERPSSDSIDSSFSRSVELADPVDLLSLITMTETDDIGGDVVTSVYTAATRTTVVTTPAGSSETFTIDTLGRFTDSQTGNFDPVSATYNDRGLIDTLTFGNGTGARTFIFNFGTDGWLASLTDALSRTRQYQRDASGRVATATHFDGTTVDFGYDANGNLTTVTPPGLTPHILSYSSRDQLISIAPPNVLGTGPTTFAYDLDGRLIKLTRPDNRSVTLGYDAVGHLTTRTRLTDDTPTSTDAFIYDSLARIDSIVAASGVTTTYIYDGEAIMGETWSGDINGSVSRTYDAEFLVGSDSVNGANTVNFVYGASSLLAQAGALTITREAVSGFRNGSTLGVVTSTMDFNGFAELDSYEARVSDNPVFALSYVYDDGGRIEQLTETIQGATVVFDYGYDLAGRLLTVSEDAVVVESYTYDPNGNRLTATVRGESVSASYDDQDRLVQYGDTEHSHDANGDRSSTTTNSQVTMFDHDELGYMRGVTLPDNTEITYIEDGLMRRVGKRIDGVLVQGFLYTDTHRVVAELDGSGMLVSRFVYADGPVPVYMVSGGSTYRLLTNQQGSVRLVVDAATGAVMQRLDYDAFGNVLQDTNPGFQPFGYAGGLYDPDTGLLKLGKREYDPRVGRWTTRDTHWFAGRSTNLYTYAFGDPINFVDRSGNQPDDFGFFDELTHETPTINPETGKSFDTEQAVREVLDETQAIDDAEDARKRKKNNDLKQRKNKQNNPNFGRRDPRGMHKCLNNAAGYRLKAVAPHVLGLWPLIKKDIENSIAGITPAFEQTINDIADALSGLPGLFRAQMNRINGIPAGGGVPMA